MTIQKLWLLIGEGGSRLTPNEKGQITQFLAVAGSIMPGYNLGEIYESFPDDFELEPFNGLSENIQEWDTLYEALSSICPSTKECWEAIREIAQQHLIEIQRVELEAKL